MTAVIGRGLKSGDELLALSSYLNKIIINTELFILQA